MILVKKAKDLSMIALIYILAYLIGWACAVPFPGWMEKMLVFDVAATVVTFVFSVWMHNSSVYDAYWSLTPMVMAVWLFGGAKASSAWQLLFFLVFQLWGARLTLNWVKVFTDFSYEDWRYRKYREENGPLGWFLANFFGIHMIPTVIVFLGMLPLFEIVKNPMDVRCVPGIAIMLSGISLEYFADRQMHAFLESTRDKISCRIGLWNYSRHPNYLGEISFWVGVFCTMLPFSPEKWFYGIGALSVAILFNTVSIPLMEHRQMNRRSDYADYRATTSRLILRPHKKA